MLIKCLRFSWDDCTESIDKTCRSAITNSCIYEVVDYILGEGQENYFLVSMPIKVVTIIVRKKDT